MTNWAIQENAIAFVDLEATFTAPVLNSGFFEVLTTSSFSFPFFFSLLSKQLMPSLQRAMNVLNKQTLAKQARF